jgi:hypothetical protein
MQAVDMAVEAGSPLAVRSPGIGTYWNARLTLSSGVPVRAPEVSSGRRLPCLARL